MIIFTSLIIGRRRRSYWHSRNQSAERRTAQLPSIGRHSAGRCARVPILLLLLLSAGDRYRCGGWHDVDEFGQQTVSARRRRRARIFYAHREWREYRARRRTVISVPRRRRQRKWRSQLVGSVNLDRRRRFSGCCRRRWNERSMAASDVLGFVLSASRWFAGSRLACDAVVFERSDAAIQRVCCELDFGHSVADFSVDCQDCYFVVVIVVCYDDRCVSVSVFSAKRLLSLLGFHLHWLAFAAALGMMSFYFFKNF